jgi:hypothetical protein
MIDEMKLVLQSVGEGECPRCQRHGEGVVVVMGGFNAEFLCEGCVMQLLDDPATLHRVKASNSVIAWLRRRGYRVIARLVTPYVEVDE